MKLGCRLLGENLQKRRAAYGKQILATVSQELTAGYGRGVSYAEIVRMIQFAQLFPNEAIVVTLSRQLSSRSNTPESALPYDYLMPTISRE